MAFTTHILVPTDFSDASHLAIDAAVLLAEQYGAKLSVVHVNDPDALRPPATLGWSSTKTDALQQEIDAAIEESFASLIKGPLASLPSVHTKALHDSSPASAICNYATAIEADLIVISTHGRTGLKHLLIGSVAERVVRYAQCPVLTLRSKTDD